MVQPNRSIWRVPAHGVHPGHRLLEDGVSVIPFPKERLAARPTAPGLVDLLPRYEAALIGSKRRPRGVKLYLWLIRRVIATLPEGATMADLNETAMQRYQEQLGARCASSTVENALFGVRRFCVWGIKEGLRDDDPTEGLEWPRVTIHAPERLKDSEVRALLVRCRTLPARLTPLKRWRWKRNVRAVYLMLYAGLRLAEAADIVWKDIDLEARELTVRSAAAKGGDERRVAINAHLLAALQAVPADERARDAGVIPIAPGGTPMTFKGLEHVFERWSPVAIGLHAHQLRHAFATRMHRKGIPVRTIQALLGHKSLETTMRYLGLDPQDALAAVEVLDW